MEERRAHTTGRGRSPARQRHRCEGSRDLRRSADDQRRPGSQRGCGRAGRGDARLALHADRAAATAGPGHAAAAGRIPGGRADTGARAPGGEGATRDEPGSDDLGRSPGPRPTIGGGCAHPPTCTSGSSSGLPGGGGAPATASGRWSCELAAEPAGPLDVEYPLAAAHVDRWTGSGPATTSHPGGSFLPARAGRVLDTGGCHPDRLGAVLQRRHSGPAHVHPVRTATDRARRAAQQHDRGSRRGNVPDTDPCPARITEREPPGRSAAPDGPATFTDRAAHLADGNGRPGIHPAGPGRH